MNARVAGIFGTAEAPAAACPAGFTRILLDPGYLEVDRSLPIAQSDGTICIALGHPRFADPRDRAAAATRSPAAAWIELFDRHGVDAPLHARGRFAAIVLNASKQRMFLAVDRFGSWPLCYGVRSGSVAFADRADSVPVDRRRISHQALFDYFYFHVIPAPRTAFEDVERLPAAHVFAWEAPRATRHRYWIGRFEDSDANLSDLKAEFRSLVRESVAREAEGHSAGAFLSGGTDSSTVAGMLTQVLGAPAKTYSIGFDVGGYDEMAYARIAAKHFGTDHHEYYVTPADVVAGLPKIAVHYDQPFGNSSVLPAWVCAGLARDDGVDKMLAGDGGDELFGGNTRYAKQRIFSLYDRVPASIRRHLVEPLLALPGLRAMPLIRKGGSYVEQASVPMPDRIEMYNLLSRLGHMNIFTPGFLARIDPHAPLRGQRETWSAIEAKTLTDRMLAFDWKYTLADNDLPKVVGSADLAGVAVGFPFLADELVDFSLRLRPEWKLKGLTLRWFFKEALRGFLPEAIIVKKKHGFGLPFGRWIGSDDKLRGLVQDALDAFGARNVVRPQFLRELMLHRMQEHAGYYGEMVWIVTVAEHWMQAHAPNWRLED